MFSKKFLSGAALTALSMGIGAGDALAQSTASQEDDVIIVTGQRRSMDGVMTAEQAARARSTITQDYIDQQQAGQTILNTINLVPGVTFTSNDAFGSSGGNLSMRGFDKARISLTFDGVPLNDTGNYDIYSNQQLDPELIQRANVNLGTTEVDSPTASATGGTVNYVTRTPSDEFGVTLAGSMADFNYTRIFGMVDTGEIGPWGTTAFGAVSRQEYDQFIGPGTIDKTQYNVRLYQGLSGSDFVSLSYHYNENRAAFYRNVSMAQWTSGFVPYNDATCARTTPGAGSQNESGTCSNFFGVRINPSNTGNIRGQSRFSLGDSMVLTVDPQFQYVRANGGGIENVRETDPRLRISTANAGVDLNGDGDFLDRINLYSPSNTNTYRYGLTASLIWNMSDTQRLRFGYTGDFGRHRQTGEYGYLDALGHPEDVFGGRDGFGENVNTVDNGGTGILQKRNRFSTASLNQLSAEYRGDFMDDALTLTIGVRAPTFTRELNQHCYAVKGSTSSTQFCYSGATVAGVSPGFRRIDVNNDGDALDTVDGFNEASNDYAPPFAAEVEYSDVLPNVGVTWRPAEGHQIFLSYAEGLSAPRNDDLYGGILVTQLDDVVPETTQSYDLGYRFQGERLMVATTAWFSAFENRILRSSDPFDPTVSSSRNVGAVDLWGADLQFGFSANDHWTLYGSAAYTNSELQQNLPGQVVGAGNQLPDVPELTASARSEYTMGPVMFGIQAKWTDERYSNDFNSEIVDSNMLVDLDVRWTLPEIWGVERAYLQLNVANVTNERFLSTISTGANGGTGFFGVGHPRTAMLTLRTEF